MDREKVAKGLHQHCEGSIFERCDECPYYDIDHESFVCRDMLINDLNAMLKEQESYKSEETHLNCDEYCRVGDVLDCFDGMDMKADEVFHAVCLIEWAMGKRSVPLSQLLKEQEAKTGHWIVLEFCANEGIYCSECHMKIFDRTTKPKKKLSQYCPHCGSKNEQFFKDGEVVFR